MESKFCKHCGEHKPLSAFSRRTHVSGKVGTQHKCKACSNRYLAAWKDQHPEKRYPLFRSIPGESARRMGYLFRSAQSLEMPSLDRFDVMPLHPPGTPLSPTERNRRWRLKRWMEKQAEAFEQRKGNGYAEIQNNIPRY